ncbi:MAG: DUF4080 domain-containing protein [Candidatus Hydrogenedens sp.]|nr:DUF4080 domain-containing protein [Candidatus Hydrogenedentota bacterium]NLF58313.1 DUF4080 domain-containing protein [Candidatus Hydrogenedens sp.]
MNSPPQQTDIVLAAVNARYAHTAIGQRFLRANLGPRREHCRCLEFTLENAPADMAETVLALSPKIVGLGAYIWNVDRVRELARILKALDPALWVVVGGPETWAADASPAGFGADYLVRGEGETVFAELVAQLLEGTPSASRVITAVPPDLDTLVLPYEDYTDNDIAHRVLYVETSRGCPCRCAFCLSAGDKSVRYYSLVAFFSCMQLLMARGARRFKFVDRTFNLRLDRFNAVLSFFLEHWQEGMQLHFEILPELLSEEMLIGLSRFPLDGLHLEVGVQSFDPAVLAAINRPQDAARTEEVLHALHRRTGARVHADLIAGLPGEGLAEFASGFDRLLATGTQEIQVGILKRLPGAPLSEMDLPGMVFSEIPPYEVLQTPDLSFGELLRVKRFARYFERCHNSGNFPATLPLLFALRSSAFDAFMGLSDRLWSATGRTHGLSLGTLARHLREYLLEQSPLPAAQITETVQSDLDRLPGRRGVL